MRVSGHLRVESLSCQSTRYLSLTLICDVSLGMSNFFRQMIRNSEVITELLRCNPSAKYLTWTEAVRKTFDDKQALVASPTFIFPSACNIDFKPSRWCCFKKLRRLPLLMIGNF